MALVADIAASWRRPAQGLRRHLDKPRSEPFLFTFLMVFSLLAFVGLWPQAARAAFENPDVPLTQHLLAAALALGAMLPFWYLLAALSHLVARALGGRGDYYGARAALFWALAVVSPLMLLQGMVQGFIGPGRQTQAVGLVVFAAFLGLWLSMLREAERG